MTDPHFDPIADVLLDSYAHTKDLVAQLQSTHPRPTLTPMAKTHVFRSYAQHLIAESDEFDLDKRYLGSGRVAFECPVMDEFYVLRKNTRFFREEIPGQGCFFDDVMSAVATKKRFLLHDFEKEGLSLWVVNGSVQKREKLIPLGEPAHVGFWPYPDSTTSDSKSFDQGLSENPFDFVGELDDVQGTQV